MIWRFDQDTWDLVLRSRVLGNPEPGSLTALQRFGNRLSMHLIEMLWHICFRHVGPMGIIRRDCLKRSNLRDRTFGWTAEAQARASRAGLRVCELPVPYN